MTEAANILHHVDEPTAWDNPVPLVFIRGWCFSESGSPVTALKIHGATAVFLCVYGLSRPDVAVAFSRPDAGWSGFSARVPREKCLTTDLTLEAHLSDGTNVVLRKITLR